MLLSEVCLIWEDSNDDPTHHHGGSDDSNNQGSCISVGGIIAITSKGPHHLVGVHPDLVGDEGESPMSIPPSNVIDLDLEATAVQVV